MILIPLPRVIIDTELSDIRRFDPDADDLTAEFFSCVNEITDRFVGCFVTPTTKVQIEQQLKLLTSCLEYLDLGVPRMEVCITYNAETNSDQLTIEFLDLDRELLPIRRRELGYVCQAAR